jgi:hypothetical protein
MPEKERTVAVISPWEKISELAQRKFRIESLPEEKMVMVWRDDLPTDQALTAELKGVGIVKMELRTKKPTEWKSVD